ncbi:holo-ACP synthase [Alloscardovia theropitheci]|uniref:Holo-[acyl-carrier-protein] synthase n=1 Tax=Alloscardovia theropitheci TaxID=2496842 RepID=A0A4R0QQ92_9BIFI|nr:holo-ACP synthase [Alloscardovia theropitheci]
MAGMGHDVVDYLQFEEQLNLAGSRFERLFSRREIAQCHARSAESGDSYAQHLAARWAGKEAFLKAWSHALAPSCDMPYAIEYFPWESIEIMSDAVHRPSLIISDDVVKRVYDSVGNDVRFHISLSHDGTVASAVVIIERSV